MHALIISTSSGPNNIPSSLLPMKGRAVVDYLISDILDQKEFNGITVFTTVELFPMLEKHFSNSFPDAAIQFTTNIHNTLKTPEDLLVCEGNVYTSLKMQDFIRAYKQFKRITIASFKAEGKDLFIPYFIIPQLEAKSLFGYSVESAPFTLASFHAWLEAKNTPPYVFKSGTGFCISL